MGQQSSLVSSGKGRTIRWPLFPVVWIVSWAVLNAGFQFSGATRDYKTVFLQVSILFGLIGLLGWFFYAMSFSRTTRRVLIVVTLLLFAACYYSIDYVNDGDNRLIGLRFAWSPKPDQLLKFPVDKSQADQWEATPQDYPRFLGTGYWAEVSGVRLDPDWEHNPPREVWRREIGAGWSSFAIVGDYAVTQEQRGPYELVVCYRLSTGEIVWTHADEARFDPQSLLGGMGGVGPRATPTIDGPYVFTQGATGIVNCLEAQSGKLRWSLDTLAKFGADNLMWGKSGSPLVVEDRVIVNVGAPASIRAQEAYDSSLVAYNVHTGEVEWTSGYRTTAYPSPVVVSFFGEKQILQINEHYLTAHRASDGQILWEHGWPGSSSGDASCSQPVPLEGNRLFLSRGYGDGASLLEIKQGENGTMSAEPCWVPTAKPIMKTKFGNVVVRDGYVYGLDGTMLQCVDIEMGKNVWKKRRQRSLGHGQIMLVGDLILIVSETGELVLVKCSPEGYRELAAMQVLDDSTVTWNNLAFSPPYLLVRNAEEVVCLELPVLK
jgi:outer membrane protein assembly factor BamB